MKKVSYLLVSCLLAQHSVIAVSDPHIDGLSQADCVGSNNTPHLLVPPLPLPLTATSNYTTAYVALAESRCTQKIPRGLLIYLLDDRDA